LLTQIMIFIAICVSADIAMFGGLYYAILGRSVRIQRLGLMTLVCGDTAFVGGLVSAVLGAWH